MRISPGRSCDIFGAGQYGADNRMHLHVGVVGIGWPNLNTNYGVINTLINYYYT